MAILDYSDKIWREALNMPPGREPDALILEGTWWRETATESRLGLLHDVVELPFPDMFLGTWQDLKIVYCCAYGAARAVEPAHIFAQIGTPTLIQIGTCGTLDMDVGTGMVALPETVAARDGVSQYYGAGAEVWTDPALVGLAEAGLKARDVTTARTNHLTWPSLFAQSDEMCAEWTAEGLVSIDMETSAVIAAADKYGAKTVSLLSVWDALPHGRTFMDPLAPEDAARLKRSNEIVFEVALEVAKQALERRAA
ncbi:phosphorylase family protein [Gymnodinialimonas sp.]